MKRYFVHNVAVIFMNSDTATEEDAVAYYDKAIEFCPTATEIRITFEQGDVVLFNFSTPQPSIRTRRIKPYQQAV